MKTVLIIDDEPAVAEIVKSAIEESLEGITCFIESDFEKSVDRIVALRPDTVVLDLMQGHRSQYLPGESTWRALWEKVFCPIIIYTGSDADLRPPVPPNHPFIKRIPKGSGTQENVIEALRGFAPAVESISKLRDEVDAVIQKVLRDTAGEGHILVSDASHLLHASRRRIAAEMDGKTITGERQMMSWEQYLVPAMGNSPLTADLLRKRGAKWDDPTAYRLVLTPSCDLVAGRCEPTLIAACCEGTLRLAKKLSLSLLPAKLAKDTETVISKALNAGAFVGYLPLPSFPSLLPVMVANLKGLEVINWETVGPLNSATHEFLRVASIDSPFREQVAWAYLTTAARPGMPDRDLMPWAEELVRAAVAE
jgi:CheY-like chemotaxis protein